MYTRLFVVLLFTFLGGHSLFKLDAKRDSYSLRLEQRVEFQLDELTVHPWIKGGYFQYDPENNLMIYLNRVDRSLKIFDNTSRTIVQTIVLEVEGPNGIGQQPTSFYWHNPDSIFVYSSLNNGKISLINGLGEVVNSFVPKVQADDAYNALQISPVQAGMIYRKGIIYAGLKQTGMGLNPVSTTLVGIDLATESTVIKENPTKHTSAIAQRVPSDYRFSSVTLTSGSSEYQIMLNYPLEHNIWGLGNDGTWKVLNAKSKYMESDAPYLKNSRMSYGKGNDKLRKELMEKHRYTGLIYDSFREVYYRICRLPMSYEKYKEALKNRNIKVYETFSVQVFDRDFNKIIEERFKAKGVLFEQGYFVDPQGLWLLCPQKESEDIMTFQLLKINKS